jgi:hypothetical protein
MSKYPTLTPLLATGAADTNSGSWEEDGFLYYFEYNSIIAAKNIDTGEIFQPGNDRSEDWISIK